MSDSGSWVDRTMNERDWLETLLGRSGRRVSITDAGFDFTRYQGELVYEIDGRRYELTIREMDVIRGARQAGVTDVRFTRGRARPRKR
jgi:hypothetical protein